MSFIFFTDQILRRGRVEMGDGPRVQIPVDKKVSTPNLGVSSESYELLFCLYPMCISFAQLVIRLMICLYRMCISFAQLVIRLMICLYRMCISFAQLVIRLMICLLLEHCRNALR